MTSGYAASLLASLLCYGASSAAAIGQEASCNDVHLLARMVRAPSTQALTQMGPLAGDGYPARLVFAFRMFEIDPQTDSARKVTELIPQSQDQDRVWHSLEGMLCDHETVEDMKTLAKLQARLPHDLAKAINVYPDQMYNFVLYAYDSVQDPHSDYAVQMRIVCRHHHERFVTAVDQMPEKDRQWLAKKIFDPAECRAFALPEAD